MRVLLLRDSRIKHSAGEIVDASPAEATFLLSVGSAVKLLDEVRIETPEAEAEAVEIPEKKKTARKTKK